VDRLRPLEDGRAELGLGTASGPETIVTADMVIAATGFVPGWQGHDLLGNLVREHEVRTHHGHLILADDCSVPDLSLPGSVLSVAGPAAAWAFPAADSFAGMKYAARRFATYAVGSPISTPRRLLGWPAMVRQGWPYRRETRRSETCASP
jgi:hypothetical protein